MAISFCSQCLVDKEYIGLDEQQKPINNCEGHAAVLTARRFNMGQCEYLVRLSNGGSARVPGAVCACKTPTNYYSDCNQVPKSEESSKIIVGCWVNGDNLFRNSFEEGGF